MKDVRILTGHKENRRLTVNWVAHFSMVDCFAGHVLVGHVLRRTFSVTSYLSAGAHTCMHA